VDKVMLVSCDGHACGPAEEYMEYMDAATRRSAYAALIEDERRTMGYFKSTVGMLQPAQVELIDDRDAIRSGKARGTYDAQCRLEEMDVEGIAAELLFPAAYMGTVPFISGAVCLPHPPELRDGGARAYNRWLADRMISQGGGRLLGVAVPGSYHSLPDAIDEMKWASEHGFVAVACPGYVEDLALPPLYDPYWEPFWDACVRLRLVVTIHAGFRLRQGQGLEGAEALMGRDTRLGDLDRSRFFFEAESDPFDENVYAPRRALWEIMLGGAFDRYPALTVVPTEVRVDWVPGLFQFLDDKYASGALETKHAPSYYWTHNCYGCSSPLRPPDIARRAQIGVSRLLFGRDFPHAESMWPNTADWLVATLRDLPDYEVRLILGLNAIDCYGLDGDHLAAVAAKVGPTIEQVVSGPGVDPRYIENFDLRAGFNKPVASLRLDEMGRQLAEDLEALSRI
jgi:predicted TIM-barrel fold metal-dependent hydrolase